FRREAVLVHLLVKAGVVLLPRYPVLVEGDLDLAVAKETCAGIGVVRIAPKDIDVLARHSCAADGCVLSRHSRIHARARMLISGCGNKPAGSAAIAKLRARRRDRGACSRGQSRRSV